MKMLKKIIKIVVLLFLVLVLGLTSLDVYMIKNRNRMHRKRLTGFARLLQLSEKETCNAV